jgi:DNA-binding response OmpR family regulator
VRVLLADDDMLSLHVLATAVEQLGHECRTAPDGDAAWALYQEMQPDVVISDLSMPGLSGADFCRHVRTKDAARASFIFMTGHDDDESYREGMAAGADDYLVKPINFQDLEARLGAAQRRIACDVA